MQTRVCNININQNQSRGAQSRLNIQIGLWFAIFMKHLETWFSEHLRLHIEPHHHRLARPDLS